MQHRHRVRYIQQDVTEWTYDELERQLRIVGCDVREVAHMHVSPPCTTYSEAHHGNNVHRHGLEAVSEDAARDDVLTFNMCRLMQQFAEIHTGVLLTQENPVGLWLQLPWVRRLAQRDNWQLVERVDHCMMQSQLDGDIIFPNKPTSYLVYNMEPQDDIPCECRCMNRLTVKGARKLHRMLVCNRHDKHPDQQVITDVLEKGRIPLMLFGHFMAKHLAHKAGTTVQRLAEVPDEHRAAPPASVTTQVVSDDESVQHHNRCIVRTHKRAKSAEINRRCAIVDGLSYDEALKRGRAGLVQAEGLHV